MKKEIVKVSLIAASTLVILLLIGMFWYFQAKPATTISASGQSTIKVMPDITSVVFNVETNASTAQEAKDKNAEIVSRLKTAIVALGFLENEITTENYNIYPDYSWENNQQVSRGYRASHSLKIEILDNKKDKIGSVIDAGVNAGALLGYINFELSTGKQNEYKALALKEATSDAKIKAESIASGLGKKLGDIVSVTDSGFDYYPWPIYRADSSSGAVVSEAKLAVSDIQPGNQEVNARVSVVWKIN
jgi:uncharacterized protein YggE